MPGYTADVSTRCNFHVLVAAKIWLRLRYQVQPWAELPSSDAVARM
jgi:hypothetical protein